MRLASMESVWIGKYKLGWDGRGKHEEIFRLTKWWA